MYMNNLIFNKLVTDFILSNKQFMIYYIIIITCTWPAEAVVLSRLYSNMITNLKKRINFNKIFDIVDNIKDNNLFGSLSLILITWLSLIIFYRLKYTMEQKLFPKYMSFIRETLFNNILESNSRDFKDIKSGEYIAIINELTHVFLNLLQMVSNKFLPIFIGLILINCYYFYLNFNIGITFFILSLIRIIHSFCKGINYSISCAERDKSYFKLNEHFNDTFNNSMNIHLNNAMNYEKKKGRKINERYDIDQEEEMKIRTSITWVSNIITILFFSIMILLSFFLYNKKIISLATLITIAFIEIKLIGQFIDFDSVSLGFFQKLGTIIATKKFLYNILKNDDNTKQKCNMKSGSININNMSFKYNKDSPYVFKNLNLNIKSGDKIGLLGRSGSGKTTLMKILLKLHEHTNGEILIGGCNINKINTAKLRDKITYINQKTLLFNNSVIKNIQYGNSNLSEEEIIKFLKKYKLYEIYNKLPDGINTKAGVNGSLLSLGMQKITMIVRGLFKNGDIFIFDEPLAGLDETTRKKIINVINDIDDNKTIIVVTHDPEILSHLNNVYKLDELHNNLKI